MLKAITVRWTHNGYHGQKAICVRLRHVGLAEAASIYLPVSAAVARRLNRLVCGMADCKCGEHVAEQAANGDWWARAPKDGGRVYGGQTVEHTVDYRGNYPQGD